VPVNLRLSRRCAAPRDSNTRAAADTHLQGQLSLQGEQRHSKAAVLCREVQERLLAVPRASLEGHFYAVAVARSQLDGQREVEEEEARAAPGGSTPGEVHGAPACGGVHVLEREANLEGAPGSDVAEETRVGRVQRMHSNSLRARQRRRRTLTTRSHGSTTRPRRPRGLRTRAIRAALRRERGCNVQEVGSGGPTCDVLSVAKCALSPALCTPRTPRTLCGGVSAAGGERGPRDCSWGDQSRRCLVVHVAYRDERRAALCALETPAGSAA